MNLRLISYKTNKMTKGSFMYAEKTDYDDIEMSSRLRNVLRRNGFESLEELREYPKEHFIKFRNMGQATLQELYQICEEQGIKLRSVEDLNDKEHGVRFDDFLCMDAFRMGIKCKDDLRRYSLEELENIRELIANAVAHRSYLEPGNIQVALYDDRLEITSPGMLLNNVTIEKMIEGYSRPRNPAIARAFAYMKIIEKWGTGIPRLFAACEEYGLPKPELIDFDGDFRVNMYRKRDANTETNTETNIETNTETNTENVGRIIRLMGEQPSITVKMIAQQLGLSVGGVRYHINKLKKDGVVEHIGSSKKGTWVIHD